MTRLMSRKEIDRQVAQQTGETVRTIRSHGFSLLTPTVPIEERTQPLIIDWDVEQHIRNLRNHF